MSRPAGRPRIIIPALLCLCAVIGCARRQALKLHYLRGFVPGNHAIFEPANIAVAPVDGDLATRTRDVGAEYRSDGQREKILTVSNAGAAIHDALMTSLADAGLKPVAIDARIDPKTIPAGVDLMLTCELEQLSVDKRFGAAQTIHGQYFTMTSRAKLRYRLRSRDGRVLYESEILGAEDEPPKAVGGEVFFPLETEPAESLSVAMSRAIGILPADPKFRTTMPLRSSRRSPLRSCR